MGAIKGDFIGFTYDNIHSSELGLMRVSDGVRYNDNLLPNFTDKSVQIPGADGSYYINSFYTQNSFNINVAFDSITESQLRKIKQLFGQKGIHTLIFDEAPYKVYKVKISSPPNLKYIAFDSDNLTYGREESNKVFNKDQLYKPSPIFYSDRIYKGEGSFSFVAYTPFARSRFKFIDYYDESHIPEWRFSNNNSSGVYNNLTAWKSSVNFVSSRYRKEIDTITYQIDKPRETDYGPTGIMVRNFGDIDTPFKLMFNFNTTAIQEITISYTDVNNNLQSLTIGSIPQLEDGDTGFQINTELKLIEGIDRDGQVTGNLYNKYITKGDFFKISANDDFKVIHIIYDSSLSADVEIKYDYLFY